MHARPRNDCYSMGWTDISTCVLLNYFVNPINLCYNYKFKTEFSQIFATGIIELVIKPFIPVLFFF